jgi:hypothetical protein
MERGTVDRRNRLSFDIRVKEKFLYDLDVSLVCGEVQGCPVVQATVIQVSDQVLQDSLIKELAHLFKVAVL